MSGNGNDGTVYGATLGRDRHGSANRAYSFDGVNDYVDVGTLGDFASKIGVSTISFWIRTADSADDVKALMGLIDDTTGNSHDPVFKIELNRKMPLNGLSPSRGDTLFYVRDDGGKGFGTFTSQDIYENTWRHWGPKLMQVIRLPYSTLGSKPFENAGWIFGIPQFFSTAVGLISFGRKQSWNDQFLQFNRPRRGPHLGGPCPQESKHAGSRPH